METRFSRCSLADAYSALTINQFGKIDHRYFNLLNQTNKIDDFCFLLNEQIEWQKKSNFFKKIKSYSNSKKPISFAWENRFDCFSNNGLNNMLNLTNILIVIGYSFPTVNLITDMKLLNKFVSLDRIYLQVDKNFIEVKSRLENLIRKSKLPKARGHEIEIIEHKDSSQFLIL